MNKETISNEKHINSVRQKYVALKPFLNERARRLWAAAEAISLGRGGKIVVSTATGLSRTTVNRGISELGQSPDDPQKIRTRAEGGGRRRLVEKIPEFGYSLQGNRKAKAGSAHPDRDKQFRFLNRRVKLFQRDDQPVISVDTKKKELIGNYSNKGKEWQPKGKPIETSDHDFGRDRVNPYGVYDQTANVGWVSVGTDHDTSEFAVESIRRWWHKMGLQRYPNATHRLITADGGGSNGYRVRLWKIALQKCSDESGLTISVCHFPPETSKWNTECFVT
jgi:hypothetical protein